MARCFIEALTEEGDVVLDPFCGRGTTLLEARLAKRLALASDLNPLAIALTQAKNVCVQSPEGVFDRIDALESHFDLAMYLPEATAQQDDIQLIYHPHTLAQLCFLRRRLVGSNSSIDQFLIGALLGIMHGGERKDGSSLYLSISMPNTFSMSPEYVRKFVAEKRLRRLERNVFEALRYKVNLLLRSALFDIPSGIVATCDAKSVHESSELREYRGKVKLALASPPYLDIVNYAKQNWIRLWFLRADVLKAQAQLDDNLIMEPWLRFMDEVLSGMVQMIKKDGIIVLVIGDVARSGRGVLSPAREIIRHVGKRGIFGYVGCLSDHFETDDKTTRIWGETRGQATAVDRVVVLANSTPTFDNERLQKVIGEEGMSKSIGLDAEAMREHAQDFAGLNRTATIACA